MKWIFVIIGLGALITVVLSPTEQTDEVAENSDQAIDESVKLVLVGDVMLDRGIEYMMEKKGNGDFRFPFMEITNYLKSADILFGNLEGPVSDKGENVGSIYSFRADPKMIGSLIYAGFDVMSLANNHAFDYGREALEDTMFRLKEVGIDHCGAGFSQTESYSPVVKEIKGTKIGFLAFTNLGPETWKATGQNSGIVLADDSALNAIEEAKRKVDVLIVSLHAGEEYSTNPTQFQIEFSKAAVDAGADLIIGHHPHIIQPNEKYKEGYIFYSLGNFVFDQGFSEETMKGQVVEVLIESGEIKRVNPKEIKLNGFFQPELNEKIQISI